MTTKQDIPDLFDDYGFVTNPGVWDRDLALGIAKQLGVGELEESHWAVIDYLREHHLENATIPWQGNICRDLDLVEHCVHKLFGGPIEAWKVSGLPDPGEEARTYMLNMEPPEG